MMAREPGADMLLTQDEKPYPTCLFERKQYPAKGRTCIVGGQQQLRTMRHARHCSVDPPPNLRSRKASWF